MHPPQTKFARAFARLSTRNPERLWIHYGFALTVFLSLIIATDWLNRTVIERGVAAAETIQQSNEQVLLAQEVMRLAGTIEAEQGRSTGSMKRVVLALEERHLALVAEHQHSDALTRHYFDPEHDVAGRISEFLGLAHLIADGNADLRHETIWQLQGLYSAGGLQQDLLITATLFAEQVTEEAAYYASLQKALFWACALVLIAEAVFVFWPAQHAVQSTIQRMQRQTNVLRKSQTRLKDMNGQLEHMVLHDALTGLPNRKSLVKYMDAAITRGQADDWQLYLVGLDGFKDINDTFGHDYGDALLVEISYALLQCVDHENIVAHVGGDAFVLISGEQKDAVLRRIMSAFDEPFEVKGRRISINASMGHLTIGSLVRKPLDIVADAEIALQFAKNAGRSRAVEFTQNLRDDLSLMQQLQMDLGDAIKNGEIEPWFQPQIRLQDRTLHGAEVLVRWRHPTRGLLTPDKFLPAAERAGLMVELDFAVWRSAMYYATNWQTTDLWHPVISLNAAPDTISDPHLLERFLLALQRSGLSTKQVVIEVLETTLIDGTDDMAAINIDSLAECGVALELDDFGTGYASLSKLTQLPLAGIKLDRSLVAPLPDQAADSVIRAILALATELGMHVVAEGVEETDQADHLNDRGCDIGQGYGFGRPMPPEDFTKWLHDNADMVPHKAADRLQA